MPLSIPELQQNDVVTLRNANGVVTKVTVQSSSRGNLDYDGQPFFIDTSGEIHWSGRAVVLETFRTEPKQKKAREDSRNWKEQLTTYPDGTPKTFKEILLSRDDGKTFEDEVKGIVDGGRSTAKDGADLLRSVVLWFPRQFPKIDNFDLDNDPRAENLIGYRPAGLVEVEKVRVFRTGSAVKLVDNKEGHPPRRFGTRYMTYFGVGLIAVPVLIVVTLLLSIF